MNGRFEGIIQNVNKLKFSDKYGVWSIELKENGKWTSVWRKDQSKADELYRLLVMRMERRKVERMAVIEPSHETW